MRIMNSRPWYVDYLFIFMGTGIMALAIQCIFEPIGLVTGGFSGIAIIIRKMTAGIVEGGVPLWLTNIECSGVYRSTNYKRKKVLGQNRDRNGSSVFLALCDPTG